MRALTALDIARRGIIRREIATRIRHPVRVQIPGECLPSGFTLRALPQMPVIAGSGNTVRNVVGSARKLRLVDIDFLQAEIAWATDHDASRWREGFDRGDYGLGLEVIPFSVQRGYDGNEIFTQWQPLHFYLTVPS